MPAPTVTAPAWLLTRSLWERACPRTPAQPVPGTGSRHGYQVFVTTFPAPVRSSAARAALDLTGAANVMTNTCPP